MDQTLAEAHLADGLVSLYGDWQFDSAQASLRRALELSPGWGEAHGAYAAYLAVVGRFEEALPRARLARRLDPAKLSVRGDLCWYLNHAGHFADADTECRRALELEPTDANSILGLAESLRQQGDFQQAFAYSAAAFGIPEPQPQPSDEAEAKRSFSNLWERAFASASAASASSAAGAESSGGATYFAAVAAALIGRDEEALSYLERGVEERDPALLHFRTDLRLAELRQDARFAAVAKRIGFPGA